MKANTWHSPSALTDCLALVLLCAGLWECGLGWAQLTGLAHSLRRLYPATGSFYNPGPYCGFLAMLLPVALHYVARRREGLAHWFGLIYLIPALALMPVLMGRTGWVAGAVGCFITLSCAGKIPRLSRRSVVVIAVLGVCTLAFLVYLKPASALGRLLMWFNGASAALEHPLTGVGWDYVAGALGNAQEAYFHSHPGSVFESVSGAPEYAFNEYLQIAIAFGLPAMLLFAGLLLWAGVSAWRGRSGGVAGGVAVFAIVCFSSYPLQFPEFIASAGALVIAGVLAGSKSWRPVSIMVCVAVAVVAVMAARGRSHRLSAEGDWVRQRHICASGLDDRSIARLDSMSATWSHSAKFLFDYGKALREAGLFVRSNEILQRGVRVSSDPMFLNLIGRNYQSLGVYDEAERYFLRSIDRLPGRIYPRYLLALLYADPGVADRKHFDEAYGRVAAMQPKVMSPAIKEMRSELEAIRDSLDQLRDSRD